MASWDRSASQMLLQELTCSPNRSRSANNYSHDDVLSGAAYEKRLGSFDHVRWSGEHSRPEVSALACARRGWVCVDDNMLQCVSCEEYLSGKLPLETPVSFYKKCVDCLADCLSTQHGSKCLFRSQTVDEKLVAPADDDLESVKVALTARCGQLKAHPLLADASAYRFKPASHYGLDPTELTAVRQLLAEPDLNELVLLAALNGWTANPDDDLCNTLYCAHCQQLVCLWAYVSSGQQRGGHSQPPAAKRRHNWLYDEQTCLTPDTLDYFNTPFAQFGHLLNDGSSELDVSREHCSWCPWLWPRTNNYAMEENPKSVQNWIYLLRRLTAKTTEQPASSTVQRLVGAGHLLQEGLSSLQAQHILQQGEHMADTMHAQSVMHHTQQPSVQADNNGFSVIADVISNVIDAVSKEIP